MCRAVTPVRSTTPRLLLAAWGALALTGCTGASDATVFEGARLIVGDGTTLENATFVVQGGRFTAVGATGQVDAPRGAVRVDLSGKTVMPALVNAHTHLGTERAALVEDLERHAYYGTAAVHSLGLDEGEAPFQVRNEVIPGAARYGTSGRGVTSPEPGRTEVPHWVTAEDEARAAVDELASQGVELVKIWVDDRGGQYDKLSPELYGAVIEEAHARGLRAAAHVYTLADAKGLLRAGIDMFAHGVRDMDVDDELVALWRERPNVVLVPNLPGPGVPADVTWLAGSVSAAEMDGLRGQQTERPQAQAAFGIQARNLARLSREGVRIAFGTDGNTPWAVHFELEDMVRSGMSPSDAIVSATSNAAELLELGDLGTVAAGKSADFLVLDANPLDDITNTRRIDAVYLRGAPLDREALAARFSGRAEG